MTRSALALTILALPRQARARLKRHVCGMCEIRLDRGWCSAVYAPRCDEAVMIRRMAACLAESRIEAVRRAAAELTSDTSAASVSADWSDYGNHH